MSTIATIFKDNWEWRGQIWKLAIFELKKQSRGAMLGWAWFFARPIIYVFCFWFALDIGLRAGREIPGSGPYILWLTAGIIPWFFMRDMLSGGVDVLRKFSYLVKKVKFPLSAITSIYTLRALLVELMIFVILILVYFISGRGLTPYLIQVPILLILMTAFWWCFSLLLSPLCAMSRDIRQLMSALTTPFFWLSGILFDLSNISNEVIRTAFLFNPISFFASGFRKAIYMDEWVFNDPIACLAFLGVFLFTALLAFVVYARTNKEVGDVL